MEKSAKFRWQKNMFVSPFINPSLPSFFLAQRWHLSFSHLHSGERQWCQKSNRHRCCRDNKWCVVEGWKEKRGIPVEISVIFPFSNEIKQKRPFLFHGGLFGKGLPPSLKQFPAFWSAGMHEFELRKFPPTNPFLFGLSSSRKKKSYCFLFEPRQKNLFCQVLSLSPSLFSSAATCMRNQMSSLLPLGK